jgi:hypothetical protein
MPWTTAALMIVPRVTPAFWHVRRYSPPASHWLFHSTPCYGRDCIQDGCGDYRIQDDCDDYPSQSNEQRSPHENARQSTLSHQHSHSSQDRVSYQPGTNRGQARVATGPSVKYKSVARSISRTSPPRTGSCHQDPRTPFDSMNF